jgi:hypothetical protein
MSAQSKQGSTSQITFIDTLRICRSGNTVKKDANIKESILSILVKVSQMVREQNISHIVGFSGCELSAHWYQAQDSIKNSFPQKVPIAAFT